MGKSLLDREGQDSFCPLLGRLPLPAELMNHGSKIQGIRQAVGMRELLGKGKGCVDFLHGLIWIAQMPKSAGGIDPTAHPRIIPHVEQARLLGVVESHPLLEVPPSRSQLSEIE
jgi:hypothetical protein